MSDPVEQLHTRPESDVSGWVGLAGLVGLLAWVMLCRNWPAVADLFALPGPRLPMAGPYAALLTVVFTGVPMVLVSLLVDKVHLRPSTGIDWQLRRPVSEVIDISIVKLAGLWATWALIAAIYAIARYYWSGRYLFSMQVLGWALVPMFLLSIPYVIWLDRVLINARDGAWHFGAMLIGREAYDKVQVAHHLRAWAVKGFFCAFMISILPPGFEVIVKQDFSQLSGNPVKLAIWLTEMLFMVDVQMAMVGYLVTMKPLDAHIRTANPHLDAWLAALICYPPFILMGDGGPLNYHVNNGDWALWLNGHDVLLWIWGSILVMLTGIYAWATVAFGLRFSNLTYRGVLTNGPYRYTRHPAYLSKNLFWWLETLPFLTTSSSAMDAVRNTALMAVVSAIYYWRAKTEERHLSAEDVKYRAYSAWMEQHGLITKCLVRINQRFQLRHSPVT